MSLLSHKEKIRSTAVADIIESCIYLKIKAESASSGPPIGPTLGQYGIPAAQFCKDFNERTVIFKKHVELKVVIYLYRSGIYTFELDFPTATFFFKRLLRISLCTGKPGHILSRRKEFVESLAAATSTSRRRL